MQKKTFYYIFFYILLFFPNVLPSPTDAGARGVPRPARLLALVVYLRTVRVQRVRGAL